MSAKLSSIQPASGSIAGDEKVIISGSLLMNVVGVHFGPAPAIDVSSDNTKITCKTPPGDIVGNCDVVAFDNEGKKSNVITYTYVQ
ncbi:IPT/TIG domain-containing protein [Streptomyces sp. NPDC048717]